MANTRILTRWEVEEFVDQVALRKSTWFGRDKTWIRRDRTVNQFAVKFVNGLPHDMSTMHVRILREAEEEREVERYVDWLLSKFTSYTWRKSVEEYLKNVGLKCSDDVIAKIARDVCNPAHAQKVPSLYVVVEGELPTLEEPQAISIPERLNDSGSIKEKSLPRYIQNLLKGKK